MNEWKESANQRRDFRGSKEQPEVPGKGKSSRKNTRRWCRGKEGREHQPETRMSSMGEYRQSTQGRACREYSWDPGRWSCYHKVICSECGKILDEFLGDRCPDKPVSK